MQIEKLTQEYNTKEEYDQMLIKVNFWLAETGRLLNIRLGQEKTHSERMNLQ